MRELIICGMVPIPIEQVFGGISMSRAQIKRVVLQVPGHTSCGRGTVPLSKQQFPLASRSSGLLQEERVISKE